MHIPRRPNPLPSLPLPGVASLVVALSPGLPAVLAGRLMYGVGIGFAMHAAPAYIAGMPPGCACAAPRMRPLRAPARPLSCAPAHRRDARCAPHAAALLVLPSCHCQPVALCLLACLQKQALPGYAACSSP